MHVFHEISHNYNHILYFVSKILWETTNVTKLGRVGAYCSLCLEITTSEVGPLQVK